MLIYHSAYDAYHCIFRTLVILEKLKVVEVVKLRILDFYFCFPAELKRIRLPRGHNEAKKIAAELANIYHGPVSAIQTFRDMEHIQLAAFRTLAASHLIDAAEFQSGLVRRSELALPQYLNEKVAEALGQNNRLTSYVVEKLADLPLLGVDGLKHRTGLLDYKYDIA